MLTIINTLFILIFTYLTVCVVYAFLFSVSGRIFNIKSVPVIQPSKKFAVFIPSYKADEVILNSAREALKQNYPKSLYNVFVIADSLKPTTVEQLRQIPVTVIEVKFEKSTKARSLNEAFRQVPEIYDYVLILDADNIMAPDFIARLNARLEYENVYAIQGHRIAKNLNSKFAILDAISEEVNNHIYRKGHRALGLSSGLIGSGMAFRYDLYKDLMKNIDAVGGFDKESELKLLQKKVKIAYAEDALIYDEKVENSEIFGNQRRRWISAQLHYFRKFFFQGIIDLITKGNLNFFDKAFQQFLLPRVLLLGSIVCMLTLSIAGVWMGIPIHPGFLSWLILLLLWIAGIGFAVPASFYTLKTLSAILSLPKAMWVMFITLFKLKGANQKFIHTPHHLITDPENT